MKKIDGYISELLYTHECVIIPGFGGFITSYAPARILPGHPTMHPPGKNILFNAQLQRNDGILANYIADKERISYEEAISLIHQFTRDCQNILDQGQSVVFEKIGTFKRNSERNLVFVPFSDNNYLDDAYGLPRLVLPPVKKDIKKQGYVRPGYLRNNKDSRTARKTIRRLAFIILLASALGSWGIYHTSLLKDIYTHYSGIIPLILAAQEQVVAEDQSRPGPPAELAESKAQDDQALSIQVGEPAVEISLPPAEKQPVTTTRYYIIAGAFKDHNNALSLVGQLQSKGYNAQMAGQTGGGLYRVCYEVFPVREDALHLLGTIRNNEDPNAWLFIQ